jgi:HK97 gp10 family phage protein
MMGGFSESFVGLKELDEKLEQLGQDAARKIVRKGLKAAGTVLQAAVREATPERPTLPSGTALPPGTLARDIEMHIGKSDEGLPAAIVQPGAYTWHVAEWVEYGHRLVKGGQAEWYAAVGSKAKRRRRGGNGHVIGDVPAHANFRKGFEAGRAEAVAVFGATVAEGVDDVIKGKAPSSQ